MAKSTRTTGNDTVADPGGTHKKPAKGDGKIADKVKSGDRNNQPAKSETRIKK